MKLTYLCVLAALEATAAAAFARVLNGRSLNLEGKGDAVGIKLNADTRTGSS